FRSVAERNQRLVDILEEIANLDFGDFEDNKIDLFGDAYEFLISNYASNAGKSGGEFFTPQSVSKLLAKIVMLGKDEKNKINKIYDPACGSGSLLLQAKKQFTEH
ncbi:N-6 DNA methylase, partial [Streptococcus suis]|uniref:N-6 DNA methylase n=1 Tax=Streptococcus suis TaxID=1307 RepID=UPI0012904765